MVVFEGKIAIKEIVVCYCNRKAKGIRQVFIKMKLFLEKPSNKKIED
jgi:phage anti-repressor protein